MAGPEMPRVLTGDDLVGHELSDWQIVAVRWTNVGVDLDVELPSTKLLRCESARLVCRWMNSFLLTVDRPGAPLSYDGVVERTASGSFRLVLAADGMLDFDCEELELRPRV